MDLLAPTSKLVSSILPSLLLLSCSGSGGGAGSDNNTPNNITPDQFAQSLIRQTATESTAVTQFWLCANADNQFSFLAVGNFGNVPVAYSWNATDTLETANIQYQWKVIGKNSLELTRENGQLHEKLTYINFSTARSFSTTSSIRGYFSCSYHTEAELDSLFKSEVTVGETLKDEPLLPVLVPDGFVQHMAYLEVDYQTALTGLPVSRLRQVALYDNGLIPTDDGFDTGVDPFDAWYRYEFDGVKLKLGGPVDGGLNEFTALPLKPALIDEKLDSCHLFVPRRPGLPGIVPGTIFNESDARLCFFPNGRFTFQSGSDENEILNKLYIPHPTNSGRYRLDGYAIRFQFDSGYQRTESFGWRDRSTSEALIVDSKFETLTGPASLTQDN